MRRALIFFAIFAGFAWATQSRVAALGGVGDMLFDETNLWSYPATLLDFSNLVWVELGTEGASGNVENSQLTVSQGTGPWALALGLNQRPLEEITSWRLSPWAQPDRGWCLFGAYKLGEVGLGVGYEEATRSVESQPSGYSASSRLAAYNLGLAWAPESARFDLGVKFLTISAEDSDVGAQLDGTGWRVGFRGSVDVLDQAQLLAGVNYYTDHLGDTVVNSYGETNAHLGIRWVPTGLRSLTLGLLYRTWTERHGEDEGRLSGLAGVVGLEVWAADWLTLRVGALKYIMGQYRDTIVRRSVRNYYANLGLGLTLGDFRLDGLLSPEALYRGPYLLGGRETGFWMVSLRYRFRLL